MLMLELQMAICHPGNIFSLFICTVRIRNFPIYSQAGACRPGKLSRSLMLLIHQSGYLLCGLAAYSSKHAGQL